RSAAQPIVHGARRSTEPPLCNEKACRRLHAVQRARQRPRGVPRSQQGHARCTAALAMRSLMLTLLISPCLALAEARSPHERLVSKYEEPDTWTNRANFYAGARGGVAIPAGATGLAPSAGLEVGVANDFGIGFGLHVIWMDNPPGAPALNVPQGLYGFGALA